jgi:uncharacterized membrane protein YhaH (DUF805 family)
MTFQQAVRSGLQNYTNFRDRSGRSEFWYWVLFTIIVSIVASIIDAILGGTTVITGLAGLALLVPNLAMAVRRLHDIGKSGWNVLWGLIPVLGLIYLIYLYVQPSHEGSNQYGSAPLAAPAG